MRHFAWFSGVMLACTTLALLVGCGQSGPEVEAEPTNYCASIHRNDSLSLSQQLADVEDSMRTKTGVYVLEDGANAMIARAWLTEYAEETIDIQYFIFSTDNVGLIGCDYLVRAADRGVKVRIIIDDILVDADIQDVLTMDSHPNIDIRIYNPGVNLGKNLWNKAKKLTTEFRSANQRMHNKTFFVDGKVLITGGRNIANEYFDYDREYNFRDRDVLLIGGNVGNAHDSFDQFWQDSLSVPATDVAEVVPNNVTDSSRFDRLHEYACNPANFSPRVRERLKKLPAAWTEIKRSGGLEWVKPVLFVSDVPGKNDGTHGLGGGGLTTQFLAALVGRAKSTIDIQTPYLIADAPTQALFRAAIERGVAVRILTNSLASTDNLEAFSAYQGDREVLLTMGVRIFEQRPDAAVRKRIMTSALQDSLNHQPIFGLHAKTMVIDSLVTVIGTFNLDPRSANLNTECVAGIESRIIAKRVLEHLEEEFQPENAWETTLQSNPDSVAGRKKRIGSWMRKILPKDIL